jgi:hypothetical protein
MKFPSLCFGALILIGASAVVADVTSPFHHLGLSAGTVILGPDSPDFANATARYSAYDAPTFSVYVKPAIEADVQKLVCCETLRFRDLIRTNANHFAW